MSTNWLRVGVIAVAIAIGMWWVPSVADMPLSAQDSGTLVVTYSTDPVDVRLDRIRFRLIDDKGHHTFFPRAHAESSHEGHSEKSVRVDSLRPGPYRLEFVVPNRDGLFKQPSSHRLDIHENTLTAVDVTIESRHAKRQAHRHIRNPLDVFEPGLEEAILTSPSHQHVDTTHGRFWLTQDAYCSGLVPYGRCYSDGDAVGRELDAGLDLTLSTDQNLNILEAHEPSTLPLVTSLYISTDETNTIATSPSGSLVVVRLPDECCTQTLFEDEDGADEQHAVASATPSNSSSDLGWLTIDAAMPSGESATITLEGKNGNPRISLEAFSHEQQISWYFDSLPPGTYKVAYSLPSSYLSKASEIVEIEAGHATELSTTFVEGRLLTISSNSDRALYSLQHIASMQEWNGRGRRHQFKQLPPGDYLLNFATSAPHYEQAPSPEEVDVNPYEDAYINVSFLRLGKLELTSNVSGYAVTLIPVDANAPPTTQTLTSRERSLTLPEGQYHVIFAARDGVFPKPASTHVTISPRQPKRIKIRYPDGNR